MATIKRIEGGITAPKGYWAAGIHSGIKKAKKDLALIVSQTPAAVAGAYTQNIVKAAPVIWDKAITDRGEPVRAFLINSGNANACTGSQGLSDCRTMASRTAAELNSQMFKTAEQKVTEQEVCVCSTGVIGVPLPMSTITSGITRIVPALRQDAIGAGAVSQAILTTDTFTKEIALEVRIGNKPVRIAGIAKGSGMIHPDMATMLSFIVTDAKISGQLLQRLVGSSIESSYNMISVDGDTSTNDTVLVMANGASGAEEILEGSAGFKSFTKAFEEVHTYLAKQIVKDGEGAGKFLEVKVTGAESTEDARRVAKSVITSNLVKTAFFGEDANWGRILCAAGYSKAHFDPMRVCLSIESAGGSITLLKEGTPVSFDEELALKILGEKEIDILLELNTQGTCSATAWGCDLSYEYVRINGEYRS